MPSLLLIPVLQIILASGFFLVMIVLIYGCVTIGDIERYDYSGVPGGELKKINYNETWRYAMIYFVPLCLLWLVIIVAIGEFVMATASSTWFISKEK